MSFLFAVISAFKSDRLENKDTLTGKSLIACRQTLGVGGGSTNTSSEKLFPITQTFQIDNKI